MIFVLTLSTLFKIDMIYDLVLHLIKQGCYNKPGNIVILAAYLGQIPKLRKRLQDVVTIVIDERDAELLEQQGIDQEDTSTVQKVQLSKQVTIRTLDNFQGEEGEVIILSLVRNSGTPFNEDTSSLEYVRGKAPIGFLRSVNRTNVGLSRAKHGLYVFGNAPELAQGSKMWSDVLKEFRSSECLGPRLPIACHRHPDYIQWVDSPGVIPVVSPNGGCCRPCGDVLSCGHICPSLTMLGMLRRDGEMPIPNHELTVAMRTCPSPYAVLSVCGEPCELQTCVPCSEEDTSDSTVDLLGQVCLRDLEDDDTLDSMTITLSCRHVFTVEALDSVTRISDFYERDRYGEWTKAILPNASIRHYRPVCPRCSGSIDSLRYGRVLKCSNHSIIQHNVARTLSNQLSWVEGRLDEIRDRLEEEIIQAVHLLGTANLPTLSEAARRASLERIEIALAAEEDFPTSFEFIENLGKLHGFAPRHTKAWRKAVGAASRPYEIAYGVAAYESDPSAAAYNNWLKRLYENGLKKRGGSTAPTVDPAQQRLQQLATKEAHTRIGHVYPRASDRFTVEAFWVTIEILMNLGLAISEACGQIWQRDVPGANTTPLDYFAEFIFLRASKDAETAYRLAEESKSRNKALICQVLVLQTQYEYALHKCRVAIRDGSLLNRGTRDEYSDMCARSIEHIQVLQTSASREIPHESVPGERDMKAEWIGVYFVHPTQIILEAWNDLARAIQNDVLAWRQGQMDGGQLVIWHRLIQEAAAENRESHTEHFYQCPKGHPYTLGECTTVLGRIWCPECGITIGDSD
ncbi:Nonribosomal peptide synthetase 1 [Aspergillus fumigatus Af293] [Rhizoctonia solani]|uniref:Nonribosomal peptide synthetase 1 [Aspergillus fumigatus Af293] n=1 Tax=Rhizoctonia solani TaxID=456999 RepID=A0A0K6FZ79_9AGAM|nr:Nonribosomal peptide synthetase 1 [Aspergillus fumigatus Af293] [Rhizoctonia solani]